MGFTIGQETGLYEDADPSKEVEVPKEPYREAGSTVTAAERADFSGTLDTTDVAAGAHADLRNVTQTFDEADANLAQRLADAGDGDDRTPEERAAQRGPDDSLIVENQGERSDAEILESLNDGVPVDPSGGANPAQGNPGDGQEENAGELREAAEERAEHQDEANAEMLEQAKQDAAAGFATDAQVADENLSTATETKASAEEVVKGNVPDVEDHLKEHPEDADDVLVAEQALAKEEDRDPRAGVEAAVEKYRLFDPSKHNVGDTKEHFDKADDAEVQRVKDLEAQSSSPRPGIMNWTRA